MIIYQGLIASDFYIDNDGHSWRIWLWKTQEDLKRWGDRYASGRLPEQFNYAIGMHSPNYVLCDVPYQHLGELHFLLNNWTMDLVAHECLHALFHYIRGQVSDFARILYRCWMDDEEEICYLFGGLVDWAYRWLWKKNPNPFWGIEDETL